MVNKIGLPIGVALLLILGTLIVIRPVMAQEEASSPEPVEVPTTTELAIDQEGSAPDTPTDAVVEEASTSAASTSDSESPPESAAERATEPAPESSPVAPEMIVEQPPAALTEVHIIGTKYTDYFTDGTTASSYPGDPEIDSHLSEPNAPIPTREGLTWVHTTGDYLYDTPSGNLEDGQYAVQANGSIIANHVFVSSTSTPDTIAPPASDTAEQDASSRPNISTDQNDTASIDATATTPIDTTSSSTDTTASTNVDDPSPVTEESSSSTAQTN